MTLAHSGVSERAEPRRTGKLRLGTRASALARAQSSLVAAAVTHSCGWPVELVDISTAGDRSDRPISELGSTGVFVSALREALLAGQIDLAVHSYKDLPTATADGLVIAAVPTREDPRDALVSAGGRPFAELPAGARIGTSAPRRVAQLRSLRTDLEYVPIRGNVDSRLNKVASGSLDAVVVARAGLARLDRGGAVTEVFEIGTLTPAPAQGALAVECRVDDGHVRAALDGLDDRRTRAAVQAERSLLAVLEAGCSAPVGAAAVWGEPAGNAPARAGLVTGEQDPKELGTQEVDREMLVLHGVVAAVDGSRAVRLSSSAPAIDAERLGRDLASDLIAAGAADLLGSAR